MSFWQENKAPLSIVFSGIVIAVSLYFALKPIGSTLIKKEKVVENEQKLEISPTSISQEINTSPTTVSIPTEKPSPTLGIPVLNENQIKQGLLSKTIIPDDKLEFQIGERIDRENKILLRGTVKSKDEESGAGFFAYCNLQKCEVTFVGQEVPKCSEVNPYGYPLSWADYCLDEGGEVVKR
ncbi:MAG: hypothetical protein Fur009_1510 [Candidatus Microgenomates bacterium]